MSQQTLNLASKCALSEDVNVENDFVVYYAAISHQFSTGNILEYLFVLLGRV